jgi:hypothetical protein
MKEMTSLEMIQIHNAIHNQKAFTTVKSAGIIHKIFLTGGCKAVKYNDLLLIEQNKYKPSEWGKQAQKGSKITWIIEDTQPKGIYKYRIVNGEIKKL